MYAWQLFHGCDTSVHHISKHCVYASHTEGSICSESAVVINA